MSLGKVVQIIGPVIDCSFNKKDMPRINDAVKISLGTGDIYAEVLQQRGNGIVRCVSFN